MYFHYTTPLHLHNPDQNFSVHFVRSLCGSFEGRPYSEIQTQVIRSQAAFPSFPEGFSRVGF
jgi:hypothetical protein